MKVTIDRQACVSCGSCWDTCPGFFEQDLTDSFSRVVAEFRAEGKVSEGTPPAEMEECCRNAADLCPVRIITVEQ